MHQDVEVLPREDEAIVLDEAFEFEIPCEGPQAYPERLGDCDQAAEWIGLKPCGHHRLFCGDCKEFYLELMAHWPSLTCGVCRKTDATFIGFELINKARM